MSADNPQHFVWAWSSGTYLVPQDMPHGTYRSTGAEAGIFEFCSVSTRSGAASNSDVIDWVTANANEPIIVEIGSEVKAVTIDGCEPLVKVG